MLTPAQTKLVEVWNRLGSTILVSKELGVSRRNIAHMRARIEKKGIELKLFNCQKSEEIRKRHKGRLELDIQDGMVIVFSDAHYFPNLISTAHKALLLFIKQFKPEVVVNNGDAFDGASISLYPRIGWDSKPTVKQEIDSVKERLGEIEDASKGKLIWCLGNHDVRYETFLAANAPQFEDVRGFTLKDHFPRWMPAWSAWVNKDVVIKHRIRNGIHATHNNTINSGVTTVTGHLHSLKVTPHSDYRGTRWGVDTGTLADPYGEQFIDYSEDNPKSHRSGFAVLTFKDGKLLDPELVRVWDEEKGMVTFRGALIQV